jgi:hypothetical protein
MLNLIHSVVSIVSEPDVTGQWMCRNPIGAQVSAVVGALLRVLYLFERRPPSAGLKSVDVLIAATVSGLSYSIYWQHLPAGRRSVPAYQ